jgi:hypothetical protein
MIFDGWSGYDPISKIAHSTLQWRAAWMPRGFATRTNTVLYDWLPQEKHIFMYLSACRQ